MADTKIGFIGAGKAGTSFGRYVAEKRPAGFSLSGYHSRTPASAERAAALTGSRAFADAASLIAASDLVVLSVPDGAVAAVAAATDGGAPAGRTGGQASLFCHLSGSLSLPGIGSIHPLAALYDRETAWEKLATAWFSIEGEEAFLQAAHALLDALGNPYCEIAKGKKPLYHAASAVASNLVCAVAYTAAELYRACGLPEDFSNNAWRPLFLENAKNIAALGPSAALTGPLERGDAATIAGHLEALAAAPPDIREAYVALSRVLVDTAREKHPDRDYAEIEALLAACGPSRKEC
ncbi:MAG: DUF2520 domain-containing protein [Clostridiales Family XIII bacterium]|jgi:predicted short-subunit dehydrogenase-like oxidoreductase (DUF2520 family)|nr:DUF2520 domain-containing protein [Clostridiales Family XIII bacterium]